MAISRTRSRLYVLSFAHFLHDTFTGVWLLVLTAQVDWLDLSYTEAGIAAGLYTFGSAITQPLFGNFFDRTGKPYLALWAVAWTTTMITLSALAPNYSLLILFAACAGVGSASFHAAGLSNAKHLAAGRGAGRATAIFLLGGNGGFAVGAYTGGAILKGAGAGALLIPALAIVIVAPVLIHYLKPYLTTGTSAIAPRLRHEALQSRRSAGLGIMAFVLIMLTREVLRGGYSTYLPQFYEANGGDLEYAGRFTAIFLLFAAIGSFTGGALSDRLPRRVLAVGSLVVLAPLSFFLLRSEGILLVALSMLMGFFVNISLPIMLLIGQEVLPGGANAASSYSFGITFFVGGLANFIIGPLADSIGLLDALTWVGLLPLITILLFFFLPAKAPHPHPVIPESGVSASA